MYYISKCKSLGVLRSARGFTVEYPNDLGLTKPQENEKIVVVRNGPRRDWPQLRYPNLELKAGHKYLVVYLGQIGKQDGRLHRAVVAAMDHALQDLAAGRCGGIEARGHRALHGRRSHPQRRRSDRGRRLGERSRDHR